MLKLVEIQSHASSYLVHHGFAATWSENNQIAMMTEKGVQILTSTATTTPTTCQNNSLRKCNMCALVLFATLILSACVHVAQGSDITDKVFGSATDGMPAAFGNFNSDKFTDLFVLRNNQKTVAILLGSDTEPLLQYNNQLSCTFNDHQKITSVVPGDFDGDAQMDVLVTVVKDATDINDVYVLWGETNKLHCNTTVNPLIKMHGQPLAMDYNQDMIVDLFGVDTNGSRMFWVFQKGKGIPPQLHRLVDSDGTLPELRTPHSHAFLDLNGDSYGDLYLTRQDNSFEIWLYNDQKQNFYLHQNISLPSNLKVSYVGQTVFQDLTLEGCLDHLVPVCLSNDCAESALLVWHQEHQHSAPHWTTLRISYKDWNLTHPDKSKMYLDTLTLRPGDFNMDGYPDLLATVKNNGAYKTVLLENVECKSNCGDFPRTFDANFDALNPLSTNTTLGVFYDFLQDGILDVILVHNEGGKSAVSAFRNSLDYDANFVKVMVSMGQTNNRSSLINNPLGIKQFTYGTNLPGPTVFYATTTQEGQYRAAISTQLPQSAHFSLMLPYTIFGLGRMPNFVDQLQVHVYGHVRQFFQLIPNSQVVVIPTPRDKPNLWKVQLFVTPSKLIVRSVFALLGTCLLITAIIGVLYWKERREDHREKLQEAHRFHF